MTSLLGSGREIGLRPSGFVEVDKFCDLARGVRRSLYKRRSFDLLAVELLRAVRYFSNAAYEALNFSASASTAIFVRRHFIFDLFW